MNNNVTSKSILIDHCKEMVKEKGIESINIRSLSERTGVSTGTIYNYFSSKDQLITETIGEIWNELFHFSQDSYEYESFFDCLSALMDSVQSGKKVYPFFFSYQAIALSINYSTENKILEYNYWSHIKSKLISVLSVDSKVKSDVFNNDLTIESFVDYIFRLFLYDILNGIEKERLLKFVSNSIY